MTIKNLPAHPFLKWVGGKKSLLPELRQRVPSYKRYIEPFIGGGALFFDIQPSAAIISDYNSRLITTYISVRDAVDDVISQLSKHSDNHSKEYYYEHRNDFSECNDPVELAAWFIYYNRTCFNGVYRVNRRDYYNVPIGSYKNPEIVNELNLRAVSKALYKVDIRNGSYDSIKSDKGDFIYLDPPYHETFTGYTAVSFTEDDQIRLSAYCKQADKKGAKFMQSNSNTSFINELYKGYNIEIVKAPRNINRNGKGRGKIDEVIIRNYG